MHLSSIYAILTKYGRIFRPKQKNQKGVIKMSKKIIGLLLVLCMVVGLLPVVALADATDGTASFQFGFNTYKTTGFDKPVYIKSVSSEMKDIEGNDFTGYVPRLVPLTTGTPSGNGNPATRVPPLP